MYVMLCTRLDIYYTLRVVSWYLSNSDLVYWIVVKHSLKYLRRIRDYILIYSGGDMNLLGYTNFDFQVDKDSYKSTSRSIFTLSGEAVIWRSIKQSSIDDSTIEAEYIVASEAAKEAVWFKNLLTDLGIVHEIDKPITLYCDNSGALANSKEPRSFI